MAKTAFTILLPLLLLLIISCSSNTFPVIPDENDITLIPVKNHNSIADTFYNPTDENPYRNVFGAWRIHIDKNNLNAEIIPARNAKAIGNIFDSDLSQFLTVSPCANCLAISNVQLYSWRYSSLNILIDFRMIHPFSNIATRPDLHGFDVRLIFVTPPLADFPDIQVMMPDGTEQNANVSNGIVQNPDGYTSDFDWLVTDERYFVGGTDVAGNLNPYIRFFDDYSTAEFDPHAPSGHNVMPVGSSTSTKSVLFGGEPLGSGVDLYAIADVAYGQSATFQNRTDPQYYLPAFNRTEAWRTEYWIENNNLSYSDPASTADVVVQVFDWQHSAIVDPDYPNPSNLSGIPESSRVSEVVLSIPDLQGALITATLPESGDGSPDAPLQYRLTVTNEEGSSGVIHGLLAVRDEMHGQASPHGRIPIPTQPSGFPYETQDIRDYSHYNIIHVNIPNSLNPNIFNSELSIRSDDLYTDTTTKIWPEFFMDRSGMKFLYEWDYDYDGVTFDVDYIGSSSEFIGSLNPGLNHVGLRVTTNSVPPRQYLYDIPVYAKGLWSDFVWSDAETLDTTYSGQSNAMAINGNTFYAAYTHEGAAQRDVFLFMGESDGIVQAVNVTPSVDQPCFNPAITVVDTGSTQAVYIAYTNWDSGEPDIYTIHGNLDGTGFLDANITPISNDPASTENNTCLFHDDTTLYAYYMKNNPATEGDIECATRDFTSGTWTFRSIASNPPAGDQNYPSLRFSSSTNSGYLVWQDGRDFATNGHDIYIARSTNFVDFNDGERISPTNGLIEEAFPSLAVNYRQIGIVYLAADPVTLDVNVHLIITNTDFSFYLDKAVDSMFTGLQTIPAISWVADSSIVLAYGGYTDSTDELRARILEVYRDYDGWETFEVLTYNEIVGTVPIGAANIFPGIASREISDGHGIENMIVFRTFQNGRIEGINPVMSFGNIRVVDLITKGKE